MVSCGKLRALARLVLIWFFCSFGLAAASPVMEQAGFQVICTAGGFKVIPVDSGGEPATVDTHTIECPLCVAVLPPPGATSLPFYISSCLSIALEPVHAAHIAALVGAPLPPRGPPSA